MSLTVPAFWDLHRCPPDYPCGQAAPGCIDGEPLPWACGPFSRVRAMADLRRCLEHAGLADIAELCTARAKPGYIEALIGRRGPEFIDVKLVARSIRKPISDANEYQVWAGRVLEQ